MARSIVPPNALLPALEQAANAVKIVAPPIDQPAFDSAGYTPIADANNGETNSGLAYVGAMRFQLRLGLLTLAKDSELIDYAAEVRLRAEVRTGELLKAMAERGERDPGGGGPKAGSPAVTQLPKLEDLGVSKTQSSRWQELVSLPRRNSSSPLLGFEHFEHWGFEHFEHRNRPRGFLARSGAGESLTRGSPAAAPRWTAEKYRRFDRGERMPADWRVAS